MSKSKTSTTTFAPDIVFYAKRTGSELSCFDRYPDWLTNWLEANKNNLGLFALVYLFPCHSFFHRMIGSNSKML